MVWIAQQVFQVLYEKITSTDYVQWTENDYKTSIEDE